MIIKSFNIERIIQSLAFLQHESDTSSYMKLIKLMFFADRLHLRRYGHLFTYDDYKAMKLGPVGSQTKDVISKEPFYLNNLTQEERELISRNIQRVGDYDIKICTKATDKLSESGIAALNFSIENFGKFDQFELADLTHDYPEWKKYEEEIIIKKTAKVKDILLEDMFDNPNLQTSDFLNSLIGYDPFEEDPDFIQFMKESFLHPEICY